ncbi:MAG: hypothetical protein ACREFP_16760 [Acetobacteraceae bacterium]
MTAEIHSLPPRLNCEPEWFAKVAVQEGVHPDDVVHLLCRHFPRLSADAVSAAMVAAGALFREESRATLAFSRVVPNMRDVRIRTDSPLIRGGDGAA